LAIAACQSDKPASSASSAAATAVAGRVIEVSGAVTVAGKPLAKGDTVKATDTIDTSGDGSVVIELAHNGVRWELGPNKHVRVDESVAWKEPKAIGSAAEGSAESTSAGRHAERAAAGTVADSDEGKMGRKEQPQTVVASAEGSAASNRPASGGATGATSGKGGGGNASENNFGEGGLGLKGTGTGGGGTGEGAIGLGGIGTVGKGGGGGGGNGQGFGGGAGGLGGTTRGAPQTVKAGEATITGGLAREIVVRIVKRHMNALRFCYERVLIKNPSVKGRLVIKLTIDKTGAVSEAIEASSTLSESEVSACVVSRFKQMQFPAPEGGEVHVLYPLVFTPPG
jgi:hypothetical protein